MWKDNYEFYTSQPLNQYDHIKVLEDMFTKGYIDEDSCLKQIQNIIADSYQYPINERKDTRKNIIMSNKKHKKDNVSKKSKKQKKDIITSKNINEYIENYINLHPEIISNYIQNNLKIDFRKVKTDLGSDRYALVLYDKDKMISKSTMCLNIY